MVNKALAPRHLGAGVAGSVLGVCLAVSLRAEALLPRWLRGCRRPKVSPRAASNAARPRAGRGQSCGRPLVRGALVRVGTWKFC